MQAIRRVSALEFSSHLSASLDSAYLPIAERHWGARLQRAYWAAVKRVLALAAR